MALKAEDQVFIDFYFYYVCINTIYKCSNVISKLFILTCSFTCMYLLIYVHVYLFIYLYKYM
jgi:hypothetical protein